MRKVTKKVFGAGTLVEDVVGACGGRCQSERMGMKIIKRGREWRCHWKGRERFCWQLKGRMGLRCILHSRKSERCETIHSPKRESKNTRKRRHKQWHRSMGLVGGLKVKVRDKGH